jgi:hypothetical protein
MMPEGTPAEYAACGRHGARRLVHHRVVDCTDAIDAIPWLETFERDIYVGDLSGEQTCVRYKEKRPVMEYVPAPDDSTDLEVIRICGVCVR